MSSIFSRSSKTHEKMWRRLEWTLWSVGCVCVAAFAFNNLQVARAQSKALETLESQWQDEEAPDDASVIVPDQSTWSPKRIAAYAAIQTEKNTPTALGILSIPKVGVRVAVFNGTSEKVLNLGAGRVPGTAKIDGPGNLAIAAHRDGFFRGLKNVALGDEISLQRAGGPAQYVVSDISIVDPSNVSVLAPTTVSTLTLITCYPFYFVGDAPQRFIVRATLQSRHTESY